MSPGQRDHPSGTGARREDHRVAGRAERRRERRRDRARELLKAGRRPPGAAGPIDDHHVTHLQRLEQLIVAERRAIPKHARRTMRAAGRRVGVVARAGLAGPKHAMAEVGERLTWAAACA